MEELLEDKRSEYSFLLVLDGVEDPHNLGALIRSADGAGVDGVVVRWRRGIQVGLDYSQFNRAKNRRARLKA